MLSQQTKVSVVISTYYRAKDLADLFNSLLAQTYKPFEVIVVDDTPAEDIMNLCDVFLNHFAEKGINLIYIRNFKKRSLTVARNIGVKNASGDIIAFFDSDVILFPNYIEKIMEVFNRFQCAVAVQGWNVNFKKVKFYYLRQIFYKIFRMSHHSKNRCRLFEYPSTLTKIVECESLHGSNFSVKSEIFNELQFDENLPKYAYLEDMLFSHMLFKKFPHCLFITPYAKCIHKVSQEGREDKGELAKIKNRCRLYVLTKLFGSKGYLIYQWQNIGNAFLMIFKRLLKD